MSQDLGILRCLYPTLSQTLNFTPAVDEKKHLNLDDTIKTYSTNTKIIEIIKKLPKILTFYHQLFFDKTKLNNQIFNYLL